MAAGIWQLRLPLPWDAVPHVNAYLLEEDQGLVLVDCGSAGHPSHRDALAAAIEAAGHALGEVRTLVGTHTHSDHVGLAAWVKAESGCEFLMHPDTAHFYDAMHRPEEIEAARRHRAWQEGVPDEELHLYADVREETEGALAPVEPDRALRDGDAVGRWQILETPGHAPSHVCLLDPARRIIILGDLLAPAFTPWFDYGYSADPVAEFIGSLERVEASRPYSVALPGHGRALDVEAAAVKHRHGIAERLDATLLAVRDAHAGAYDIARRMFDARDGEEAVWRVTEVACYLRHLRLTGAVTRHVQDSGRFIYSD